MHDTSLLVTFAGALAAAVVLGFFAHRLGMSPIVGYLLAGIAVGPFTPGFVANRALAEQLAEIGVILLLFGVGLRFNVRELFAIWRIAVPGALIQSAASTILLASLLRALGWTWSSGIVLGMAISVASTVVMALVLGGRHDLHTPIGHIAIGWTVVEDIITVTILLLLPIVYGAGPQDDRSIWPALGLAALKIAALVVVVLVLGRWVVPWMLERIARSGSRELFTLGVLVLAVGIAVGAAAAFGVSIALGAFLAGLAVGRSEFAARAAGDAVPMRDAFAVLFFVSVGMLFDPRGLAEAPLLTAIVLAVVVVGKPIAAALTVRMLGQPSATALAVGAAFSQVGEFSFILGVLARQLGLLSDAGWDALVAASIISIALNPVLYGRVRRLTARRMLAAPPPVSRLPSIDPQKCILVGFGPVGRTVHRVLKDFGATMTVIELNLDTVRTLKAGGTTAIYGDVLRPETLEEAELASAATLILSAEIDDAPELIRQARLANPRLRVLARCAHLRDAEALRRAGASDVVIGEAEVALALAESSLAGNEAALKSLADHRDTIREHLAEEPSPAPP